MERIFKVNDVTAVAAGGEISDFQAIQDYLRELVDDDFTSDDGVHITAKDTYAYLTRVLYNRRNK